MSLSLWKGYWSVICLRVVFWIINSSGLNFLLLTLPGHHCAAQVYKVIFNSCYKSRFMSLFLLFSMKWLCRIFPFTPLSSLYYFYSPLFVMPEESNLLFRIFLQKIGLFLPPPLFIQPPSQASVQAKHSCRSQVFCPRSTTQSSLQGANTFTVAQSPYRNTLNNLTLHHHTWKTKSLLLQISC